MSSSIVSKDDLQVPSETDLSSLGGMPVNYEVEFLKLQNQVEKTLENIKKNRKHGRNLCNELFSLLKSTELFAFDLYMIYADLDESNCGAVMNFIRNCYFPKFEMDRIRRENVNEIVEHICDVHTLIHYVLRQIGCILDNEISSSKHFEFRDLCDNLYASNGDKQYVPLIEQDENANANNKKEPLAYHLSAVEGGGSEAKVSEGFENFIYDFLALNSKESNEEIAKARALFGKILMKLSSIDNLKAKIYEMRSKTTITDGENIKTTAFDSSPYVKCLNGNSTFLLKSIGLTQSYNNIAERYTAQLEKSNKIFENLKNTYVNTLTKIQEIKKSTNNSIEKKKSMYEEEKDKIIDFVDVLLPEKKSEEIQKCLNEIESIDKSIIEQLKTIDNSNIEASVIPDLYLEVNNSRQYPIKLITNVLENRRINALNQNGLFRLAFDELKNNETNRLHEKEIVLNQKFMSILSKYKEERIENPTRTTIYQKMDKWTNQLNKVINSLNQTKLNNESIDKKIEDINTLLSESNDDISKLEEEYNQLQKQKLDLLKEEIDIKNEINEQKEILFEQLQENNIFSKYNVTSSQVRRMKYDLKLYKKQLLCPLCKERICEVIINKPKSNCCHSFCKRCVESLNGKCPCGAKFTEENLCNIYYKP